MRIRSIEHIVDAGLCIGCGLCQSIAGKENISVQRHENGFLQPAVNSDDKGAWREISKVCPGLSVRVIADTSSAVDELWGPTLATLAGHAADNELQWRGSSGGVVSAILCYLLDSGNVQKVVHIGTNDQLPLENQVYVNDNAQQVIRCAGSRYAPAAPLTNIKAILDGATDSIAFVGKPCDVAALRAFLRLRPDLRPRVKCLLSFFCAGTPSFRGTETLLEAMELEAKRVKSLQYRGNGWPGETIAVSDDGRVSKMRYEDSWGKILNRHLHFRCKICADGDGELSDITCGDAWYLKEQKPDFEERPDRKGRSLVIARTGIGLEVITQARAAGYLVTEPLPIRDLEIIQPFQAARKRQLAARLLGLALIGAPHPSYRGFRLIRNALRITFQENWDSLTGVWERIGHDNVGFRGKIIRRLY